MPIFTCPTKTSKHDCAIISVGDNSYDPPHPYDVHMDYLKNELKYKLIDTRLKKYIQIPSVKKWI